MPDTVQTPPDPFIGQLLAGRFLPRAIAHRTADAIVYDGIDQNTRTAVRIQRPATIRLSQEQLPKVQAASQLIAKLRAVPGVVCPIGGGIQAGIPFLALPTLASGTLADRLRHLADSAQAGLSTRSIRLWLAPIAATLDAVHALGLFHGRLTPDSIGFGSEGSPQIDGLPFSQLLHALGVQTPGVSPGDTLTHYVAPEVAKGAPPTASSDQYSLAAIVAEALGHGMNRSRAAASQAAAAHTPPAITKILAGTPQDRFASCRAFASALLAELDSSKTAQPTAPAPHPDAPLELDAVDGDEPHRSAMGTSPSATHDFALELEDVESDSDLRARRHSSMPEEENPDLLEMTFTKPGESLLTPKSAYTKATSLGGVRASWRRMGGEFKGLENRKKLATTAIGATLALLLALWIVQAAWRAATYVVSSGHALARDTMEKLRPNVAVLEESRQQFTDTMRRLWDEAQSTDEAGGNAEEAPQRRGALQIEGGVWPDREQDVLPSDLLKMPADVIAGIMQHKGVKLTQDGLGVFHVDAPSTPDKPTWIGGFGLVRKPGVPVKPLLHGTVVHNAEDGSTFVARYLRGDLQDFWLITGPDAQRIVSYSRMSKNRGKPVADGAAFVLDQHRTTCLALVHENGTAIGGQWCKKKQDKEKGILYEPPIDIVNIDVLKSQDPDTVDYIKRLEQALAAVPEIQKGALAALRKFKQSID